MATWDGFGKWLQIHQPSAAKYLYLMRTGQGSIHVQQVSFDADNNPTPPGKRNIGIHSLLHEFAGDICDMSRGRWRTVFKRWRDEHEGIGVSFASLKKAKKSGWFDPGNGYLSSIGKQLDDFKTAVENGWTPAQARINTPRGASKAVATGKGPVVKADSKKRKRHGSPVKAVALSDLCDALPTASAPATPSKVWPVFQRKDAKLSKQLGGNENGEQEQAEEDKLYQPPGELLQRGRFAGLCEGLRRHLVQKRLWGKASKAHWDAIRDWTKTKEGRDYLRSAQLDPEGIALDHINDKETTPLWHALNCYFMPTSVNSHFNERTNKEKLRYVGDTAATVSAAFLKWYIEQANMLSVDCGRFCVEKAVLGSM